MAAVIEVTSVEELEKLSPNELQRELGKEWLAKSLIKIIGPKGIGAYSSFAGITITIERVSGVWPIKKITPLIEIFQKGGKLAITFRDKSIARMREVQDFVSRAQKLYKKANWVLNATTQVPFPDLQSFIKVIHRSLRKIGFNVSLSGKGSKYGGKFTIYFDRGKTRGEQDVVYFNYDPSRAALWIRQSIDDQNIVGNKDIVAVISELTTLAENNGTKFELTLGRSITSS